MCYLSYDGAKLQKKYESTKFFQEKLTTLYNFLTVVHNSGLNSTLAICVPQSCLLQIML